MKKANVFNKDMNERIAEFMTLKVSDITSSTRHRKEVEAIKAKMRRLPSTMPNLTN